MRAIEHHISVIRTARYYTLGNADTALEIIFSLHGYNQLANNFINLFSVLDLNQYFIVAPEALSRYYTKGYYGNVGASWMTKEDRENEIIDYVEYIEKVFSNVVLPKSQNKKVTAFGYSQGTASLSRWLVSYDHNIDKAIYWCGFPPDDVDIEKLSRHINHIHLAENDPLIPENAVNKFRDRISQFDSSFKLSMFIGKHEIKSENILAIF